MRDAVPAKRGAGDRKPGEDFLNYRHHFHAGNFADVQKHAILLQALASLTADPTPLDVIDTHAGAGVYDLRGDMAQRSRESEAGVAPLLSGPATPAAFAPLKAGVAALNEGGPSHLYPGSPWLIARALRAGDRYRGCELRPDDHGALAQCLIEMARTSGATLRAIMTDGFALADRLERSGERTLLLIDPPYERGDDYARIAQTLGRAHAARPGLAALVWAPVKDLETFDALLRALEGLPFQQGWAAEVRLRPLRDPMRLNGSALIGLGLPIPPGTDAICAWAAAAASTGEAGSLGRVTPLFV